MGGKMKGPRPPGYHIWLKMRDRCKNPRCPGYPIYGGRGIKVCERWDSFALFAQDMGPRPPGYSIERINNDGDYEPSNCRWASRADQGRNTRRNLFVVHEGKRMCITDASKAKGINRNLVRSRMRDLGIDAQTAFDMPVEALRNCDKCGAYVSPGTTRHKTCPRGRARDAIVEALRRFPVLGFPQIAFVVGCAHPKITREAMRRALVKLVSRRLVAKDTAPGLAAYSLDARAVGGVL